MAAQGEPGYLAAQSDPGSNSERSTDSPVAGSEDDLVAAAPLHSPEWSEERFRVDRKKLEAMLQAMKRNKGSSDVHRCSVYRFTLKMVTMHCRVSLYNVSFSVGGGTLLVASSENQVMLKDASYYVSNLKFLIPGFLDLGP
ncbi:hypothetical protein STEG23_029237 [Scotinomys teguina]